MSILPSNASYQKIILESNLRLNWPFYTPTGSISITDIMDIETAQDGWELIMPAAQFAQTGTNFLLNNTSLFSFKLMLEDGLTELVNIEAGEVKFINLTDNTTSNGIWSVLPFGAGQNAISSVVVESLNDSLKVSNGTLIPPGGVIDLSLSDSLINFNSMTTTGFPVVNTLNPLTFSTIDLIAGENIIITNPDGIDGDPVINLNSTVTSLSSLEVGDIALTGSIVTSNVVNGSIDMVTNGTGQVNINGVTIDINNNVTNINDLTVNGRFINPLMPAAWCVFTDTVTGDGNTIVNEASENIASITGSNGSYVINFAAPMSSINYAVILSLGSNGAALPPPVYHAFGTVKDTTALTIVVLDASGEFVQSAPDGVSVLVMSN